MNLLLLDPGEWQGTDPVTVTGRRATHLLEVLRVGVGDTVRCGVVDGPTGTARIAELTPEPVPSAVLVPALDGPTPEAPHALLLAVPRPRVLQRILAHAAALGFGEIVLLRTWTTDRAHVEAVERRMAADRAAGGRPFAAELLVGLEQGRRTRMPRITCAPLFRPFAEDRLPGLWPDHLGVAAHPGADRAAWGLAADPAPLALALGPERGFTGYEVERLAVAGMLPVHAGPHPFRTETALAVFAGLTMARRGRA